MERMPRPASLEAVLMSLLRTYLRPYRRLYVAQFSRAVADVDAEVAQPRSS